MFTIGQNAQVGGKTTQRETFVVFWTNGSILLFSAAVDFAKTGVSAGFFTKELRPERYPHYMEKHDKESYQSTTILGKLYDCVKGYSIFININGEEEIAMTSNFPYHAFQVNGYRTYQEDARATKSEYDRELKRLMRQYGIRQEQEVMSGYILQFNAKQYAKDGKFFELKKDITHAYRAIREKSVRELICYCSIRIPFIVGSCRFLQMFWREFYEMDDSSNDESDEDDTKISWSKVKKELTWKNQFELLAFYQRKENCVERVKQKASAWFTVTYEPWRRYLQQAQRSLKSDQKPVKYDGLLSFAWLVYPVLLTIFQEKNDTEKTNGKKRLKRKRPRKKRVPTNKRVRSSTWFAKDQAGFSLRIKGSDNEIGPIHSGVLKMIQRAILRRKVIFRAWSCYVGDAESPHHSIGRVDHAMRIDDDQW